MCISGGDATCAPARSGTQKYGICTLWRIPGKCSGTKKTIAYSKVIYICFLYKVYTSLSKRLHIPNSGKITVLRLKTFLTHFQQNDWNNLTCVRTTSYIRIIHEIFMTKLRQVLLSRCLLNVVNQLKLLPLFKNCCIIT